MRVPWLERKAMRLRLVPLMLAAGFCCLAAEHPTLSIGSPAPAFELPGIDGQVHRMSDYASSPVLVVIFTCNHCPIAQMYEERINAVMDAYRGRGVSVVAIQPNDPKAIRVDELDSSDMSDSMEEMKVRAAWSHIRYPYLYDGDTQAVAEAYGPKATPHVFVFDKDRKLRYEGRFDNSYRRELVKSSDARNAIDAVLAGGTVAVPHTSVFGCSTKWKEKAAGRVDALKKMEAAPVTVEMAAAGELKKLRANPTGKLLLVSFWATWCGSCIHEFGDLQTTWQMYRVRDFDLITVAANNPDEQPAVQKLLEREHAATRNLLFASEDTEALQKAFDPEWHGEVPYTVLIAPDGKIVWRKNGELDMLELRRTILANMAPDYIGFQQYWNRP
jgi:peroxiredoxin